MTTKTKSLHNIVIEGCRFTTQLSYNINTDHIGIVTIHIRSDFWYAAHKEEAKAYQEANRDPNISRMGSEEHRIKMSCIHQGIAVEDFNGFATESKYCEKFNNECREKNRNKYDRECFICGKNEKDNGRKLSVHHVDMNKNQGCDSLWSLVPLCASCHGRAHSKLWQSRIEYLLN